MVRKTHELVRTRAHVNAQSECPRAAIVEHQLRMRRIIQVVGGRIEVMMSVVWVHSTGILWTKSTMKFNKVQ